MGLYSFMILKDMRGKNLQPFAATLPNLKRQNLRDDHFNIFIVGCKSVKTNEGSLTFST